MSVCFTYLYLAIKGKLVKLTNTCAEESATVIGIPTFTASPDIAAVAFVKVSVLEVYNDHDRPFASAISINNGFRRLTEPRVIYMPCKLASLLATKTKLPLKHVPIT